MKQINEIERQLIHIALGLFALLVFALFGRTASIALVFCALLAGMAVMHFKMRGAKIPGIDHFIERFERQHAVPGYGSLWYAVGVLFLLTFLVQTDQIAASLIMLALGDGMSTIVGRMGRHKIFYNKKKTWEGTAAFIISSLPVLLVTGMVPGALAILGAAFVESLPLGIDDNLSVSLACVTIFRVIF